MKYARRTFLPDSDHASCHGRFKRRWKDSHRHTAWQESHRRLLAARIHLHRCGLPRNPTAARILKWNGRGYQGTHIYLHSSPNTHQILKSIYRQLQSGTKMNSNLSNLALRRYFLQFNPRGLQTKRHESFSYPSSLDPSP